MNVKVCVCLPWTLVINTAARDGLWNVWNIAESCCWKHILSIGGERGFMVLHWFRHLIFQSAFPYLKGYILLILQVIWENLLPSQMMWSNCYIYIFFFFFFAAYKAMTVQYLMDLKPWDLDCTGQASEHPGKPVLVLKLPICSTTRETGTEAKE